MTENNAAKAVQEAERIAAADEYFKARAWLTDTNDNRRIFEAGFDRAYALLSKLRAEGVQAGDERAAFEAWAATEIPAHKLGRAPWPHEDQYNWASMEYAWSIWRKIRAALASAPVAGEAHPVASIGVVLGLGEYLIQTTASGEPAQVVFSQASDHDRATRTIGDLKVGGHGQFDHSRIRGQIQFTSAVALDALEVQLRELRKEHWPDTVDAAPQASEAVRNAALEEAAIECESWLMAKTRSDLENMANQTMERMARHIRALKAQADKDGGDCAKGGEYEDLLALMERAAREAGGSQWVAEGFESRTPGAAFYGGLIMNADGETVVAQCVNESNASHMMSSSPANVLWLICQYRAALSPTQPTEQGERDAK